MHKFHTKTVLPGKPSELITLAMDDLNRAERSDKYSVSMSNWHYPMQGGERCYVCFAGAVMAMTMKVPIDFEIDSPDQFLGANSNKLASLDYFRLGNVRAAFGELGRSEERGEEFDRNIPSYIFKKRAFKLAMRRLARDLEKAGL